MGNLFPNFSVSPGRCLCQATILVDDISLLLSLDNDPDERIQMGLDEIREKHGLPVKEYE